jgi:hypothetical protein
MEEVTCSDPVGPKRVFQIPTLQQTQKTPKRHYYRRNLNKKFVIAQSYIGSNEKF